MDGIKNIDIKNFRGIEHLNIDDFSRVNVFVGHNNSGKSTILEALMLQTGMSNPDIPQQLNTLRSINPFSNLGDIRYMFYGMDMQKTPEFSAELFDTTKRQLKLNLAYTFDENSQQDNHSNQPATSETKTFFNTLNMAFETRSASRTDKYKCSLITNQSGQITRKNLAEGYLEKISASFISANLAVNNAVWDLSEIIMRKQKDVVLERLAIFDSRINAIEVINNNVFIGFDGINELLPFGMTGDGLRRYLNIVASTANEMNNIILIDEIDNGLHYTAYKKLWESIFMLAVSTNKQVFITTHSKETLMQLNEMLEEHPEYQEMFRMYTIEKTQLKGHKAYKYGYEGLKNACMNDVELRSIAL